jgi:hypothetical protein
MTDAITIIRSRHLLLTKRIYANGRTEPDGNVRIIDLYQRPIADLDELAALIGKLIAAPHYAVVFGAIADPERTRHVRRLAYADKKTGDQATLCAVPHRWCAIDVDGVARPEHLPAYDLTACAAHAIQRLPSAFHGVRCIVQATASHGIKPGCRLRLWYWLSRPATGRELTTWLRNAPADPSVFRVAQPIYTAAPVFAAGARDHLPERMIMLPGTTSVPLPFSKALQPLPPQPMPTAGIGGAARYAFAALTNAAIRIGQAHVGQRHSTILREARGLARLVAAGLLTGSNVAEVLRNSGQDVGTPAGEIDAIIAWAMAHPYSANLPELDRQ